MNLYKDERLYYTPEQVAQILKTSLEEVNQLVADKKLEVYTIKYNDGKTKTFVPYGSILCYKDKVRKPRYEEVYKCNKPNVAELIRRVEFMRHERRMNGYVRIMRNKDYYPVITEVQNFNPKLPCYNLVHIRALLEYQR